MIHIQQGALCPFKEQILALGVGFIELTGDVRHHGQDLLGLRHGLVKDGLKIQRRRMQHIGQDVVV